MTAEATKETCGTGAIAKAANMADRHFHRKNAAVCGFIF